MLLKLAVQNSQTDFHRLPFWRKYAPEVKQPRYLSDAGQKSRELTTPPEPPNIDMQWVLHCAILPYHLRYIDLSCMLHFLVVYATFPCSVCYISMSCMLLCAILPCHLWYMKELPCHVCSFAFWCMMFYTVAWCIVFCIVTRVICCVLHRHMTYDKLHFQVTLCYLALWRTASSMSVFKKINQICQASWLQIRPSLNLWWQAIY